MTTKHTPGPWEWGGSMNGSTLFVYRKTGDEMQDALAVNGGPGHICNVTGTQNGISEAKTPTEGSANARLIAAAPDLLEALVDLLAHCRMEIKTKEDQVRWVSVYDDARSAIAKATDKEG